jgi:hypothetical protein
MNRRTTLYPLMGLICFISLQSDMALAGSNEIGMPGCDRTAKSPPLRYPGNKNLPQKKFKPKAFFTKGIAADAVLVSYEMLTYKAYQKKYDPNVTQCEISPDRMLAVLVVDYPKGLKTRRPVYSKAHTVSAFDAQTAQGLSFSSSGDEVGESSLPDHPHPQK